MSLARLILQQEDERLRSSISAALYNAGFQPITAPSEPESPVVFVVHDLLGDVLQRIRELSRSGSVPVLTLITQQFADADIWKLLQAGSSDVISWTDQRCAVDVAARVERWMTIARLLNAPVVAENLIGRNPAFVNVVRQTIEIACFSEAPILITGETGTGKELLARLIHTMSPRNNKGELVILDCTTVIPELSGSEFFGHERGSYTGALNSREGSFSQAAGGTLFLDEVGELEPRLQSQLLRVIQEKTFKPVGGNSWRKADFRLVCATSRNLSGELNSGAFRTDFYYRIAGCMLRTVPLSERRDDIPLLARHFIKQLSPSCAELDIDPAVERYLASREYPGNVRDLRQLVARMVARHVGNAPLRLADIPEDERPATNDFIPDWRDEKFTEAIRLACLHGARLKEIGRAAEEAALKLVMEEENGKLSRVAARLGVTERALQLRRSAQRAGEKIERSRSAGAA